VATAIEVAPAAAVGHPVTGGCGGALTTALGTLVAADAPAELLATTRTRNVFPASIEPSVKVDCVAPWIAEQLLPVVSHRCH